MLDIYMPIEPAMLDDQYTQHIIGDVLLPNKEVIEEIIKQYYGYTGRTIEYNGSIRRYADIPKEVMNAKFNMGYSTPKGTNVPREPRRKKVEAR